MSTRHRIAAALTTLAAATAASLSAAGTAAAEGDSYIGDVGAYSDNNGLDFSDTDLVHGTLNSGEGSAWQVDWNVVEEDQQDDVAGLDSLSDDNLLFILDEDDGLDTGTDLDIESPDLGDEDSAWQVDW